MSDINSTSSTERKRTPILLLRKTTAVLQETMTVFSSTAKKEINPRLQSLRKLFRLQRYRGFQNLYTTILVCLFPPFSMFFHCWKMLSFKKAIPLFKKKRTKSSKEDFCLLKKLDFGSCMQGKYREPLMPIAKIAKKKSVLLCKQKWGVVVKSGVLWKIE